MYMSNRSCLTLTKHVIALGDMLQRFNGCLVTHGPYRVWANCSDVQLTKTNDAVIPNDRNQEASYMPYAA